MNEKKVFRKEFTAHDGKKRTVTYIEIKNQKPGPVLTLIAGQHGMEHIGPVLLKDMITEFEKMDFKGVLRICPCVNPFALELDYEFYPEFQDLKKLDEYFYSRFRHDYEIYGLGRQHVGNMNRVWNRKDLQGVTVDITRWIWDSICVGSDIVLDFHCLQAEKPLIFAIDTPENIKLSGVIGIEAIYTSPHDYSDTWSEGCLERQIMKTLKRPGVTIEFSCQHGYKKNDYEIGHRGILNVMKAYGMTEGTPKIDKAVNYIKNDPEWIFSLKTDKTGHIHYFFEEYEAVKKGDIIFEISSLETLEILDSVKSPVDGIMGKRQPYPISSSQRPVCNVARSRIIAEP